MRTAELTRSFWEERLRASDYNRAMHERLEPKWTIDTPPGVDLVSAGAKRVGYIVATCSPCTLAHLELAEQAVEELDLDHLFFLVWPFHYIPGFHARPIEPWVEKERLLPWEDRVDLVARGAGDPRIRVLTETADWYRESGSNFDADEPLSAFWTGTWYVIRKLQWQVRTLVGNDVEFYFVCGADQFNPNVRQFVEAGGSEKVWKDYSIVQQLAIHHVYGVARGSDVAPLEEFLPPFGSVHDVFHGAAVPHTDISATAIRFRQIADYELERCVAPTVATRIRERGWWGYQ